MFGHGPFDELDAGVDHRDRADDDGGDRFVANGDGADDGSVFGVVPDVAVVYGDSGGVEALTEPVTEWSTGPPEHLDGLDPAVGSMVGRNDGVAVYHPPDRPHDCA